MKPSPQSAAVRMMGAATGPETTIVTIKNTSAITAPVEIRLVGGRQRFSLGVRRTQQQIKPHGIMRVPVRFQAGGPGHLIAGHAEHRASLQVIDTKTRRVMEALPIVAVGPVIMRPGARPCLHSPRPARPRRTIVKRDPTADPPPTVERTVYRPGTTCWVNSGSVETWWRINNIEVAGDWVNIGAIDPGWGDGIPDAGGWGTHYRFPEAVDHCEGGGTWTVDRTFGSCLMGGNSDGTVEDLEWFYSRRRVGYGHAAVPNDPALSADDIAAVGRYLEDIGDWVRANGLANFIRYADYWNENVRSDPDWSDDYLFNDGDPAPDAYYLRATVGAGGLADDVLEAMDDMMIYVRPGHLPRTFRPDVHFDPENSRLCEEAVGMTYGLNPRDPGTYGEWIALCLEGGADDMTLCHELFHYASRENYQMEDRAFLMSYLYMADTYGMKPDPDWSDWTP